MAGLAPLNLRQFNPVSSTEDEPDIIVEVAEDTPDRNIVNDNGDIVQIEHDDGSITISLDGNPIEKANNQSNKGWFDNLVDEIDNQELGRISEELLRGIDNDITSRTEWIEDRATGLQMLGLKIKIPSLQGATDGAPVEGMSQVRHPLLLEAVLRGQANARSEFLPTDGPVKIRNDDTSATSDEDGLAEDLEKDLNHFLTTVATEYYPDTDRMLLMLFFGGTSFKKVYFCPLRNRPVIESVDADDLIVNNSATDLGNSRRITHRILMRPSLVKRMQILGVYKEVDLETPISRQLNSLQREEKSQQGISDESVNPEDRDREIYECYCELDIQGFEHKLKGKITGLEIPYRVTLDLSSRQILSIARDYDEETKDLPERRETFVDYTYVPGFGFYGIGLLHILGNATNALTAAWREMLDNGMYANFPGFLIAKVGSRQNTNLFRVPPGGGQQVDTGQMPIKDAIMPLPYHSEAMAPLMALVQSIEAAGQRVGGTSEVQVGEGRADAPVGTTLAMLEQATKVENSIHKRMHSSQAREFQLLKKCFQEHPESFWQRKRKMARPWDEQTFLKALNDYNLVPQADPNTASHTQRIIKYMALKQMQSANPNLYDPIAIDRVGMKLLGFGKPEEFMVSAEARAQQGPPPEVQKEMAKLKIEQQKADTSKEIADAKVAETKAKIAQGSQGQQQIDTPVEQMDAHSRALDAQTKAKALRIEDENRDKDRASHEKIALLGLAKDVLDHPDTASQSANEIKPVEEKAGVSPDNVKS